MTKKQFEWLRNHQPIEVSYVCVYEEHKKNYPYYCHINEVDFKGDNIVVKGVAHKYINKDSTGRFTKGTWKEVNILTSLSLNSFKVQVTAFVPSLPMFSTYPQDRSSSRNASKISQALCK